MLLCETSKHVMSQAFLCTLAVTLVGGDVNYYILGPHALTLWKLLLIYLC